MKKDNKNQKTFLSYLFVILSLFILTAFTYPVYQDIIVKNEKKSTVQAELSRQSDRLSELQRIHALIQDQDDEIFQRIENISQEFREDDIFEYIHNYARSLPARPNVLLIREINFGGTELTDIGFLRTTVDLSLVVSNEQTLFNFFDYLTDDSQRYRFYIPNFSYQLGNLDGSFSVQIPLVLYHR